MERLHASRGELWLAEGPSGRAVVRRFPGHDAHAVLDEALHAVRFDHPHLARILDAGLTDDGVCWVAREDVPGAFAGASAWPVWRDAAREALGALGALDGQGHAHGRLHRGNLRVRDGRVLLVDGVGRGDVATDLTRLAVALGAPPADAPLPAVDWHADLGRGRWDRPVDAVRALARIDASAPRELPRRDRVGYGLLPLRPAPLRGRDRERARLDDATAAGATTCRVVAVSAEPGMGSSRLVHASASRAHRRGAATAFRGRRLSELVPDGPGADDLREQLHEGRGTAGARYARLRHALVDAAGSRTPVVVLDDAHHQPEHLAFAQHWLARRSPGVILLDIDSRELERPRLGRALASLVAAGAEHMQLGPVGEDDLFEAMLHLAPDHPDLARSAAMVAEGSPLAAHLALLTLVRTGEVPLDRSPWGSWLDLVVPLPHDQQLLEAAAVLEDPVDPGEWMRVGTLLGLRWSKDLPVRLRLHGLARRSHGMWRVAHASLRDLLRQRCRDAGRWAEVHRACAHAVQGPRAAERRGRHLLEARDTDGAAEALLAGADAEDPDALSEVLGLLAEALEAAPDTDARRVRLGLARLRLTEGESALEVARDVAKHGSTEDRFRVAVHMVGALRQATHAEQDTWVARTFALARKLGQDEAMGLAWQGLASVRLARGDLAGAERALSRAHGFFADPEAAVFRAELLTSLGRPDEAAPVLAAVDPDNDLLASRLQAAWGHRAYGEGHLPRALLHYRAAEILCDREGQGGEEAAWHVGKTLARLGRLDEASTRFRHLARSRGSAAVAGAVGQLVVAAERGDRPATAQALEWLIDHAEVVPDPAVGALLQGVCSKVDEGMAAQIRAVIARCGGG